MSALNLTAQATSPDPAILTDGSIPSTGPDAGLIAACRAFGRCNAMRHEIDAPSSTISDEEAERRSSAWIVAKDRVSSLAATTSEGRAMKAAVAFAAFRFRVNWSNTLTWQEQADATSRLVLECLLDTAGGAA